VKNPLSHYGADLVHQQGWSSVEFGDCLGVFVRKGLVVEGRRLKRGSIAARGVQFKLFVGVRRSNNY